jgi:hypothetical protein
LSGLSTQVGYAKARGKLVVGVRTDFRAGEDRGLNLMVSNICSHLIASPSTSVTLEDLAEEVAGVLAESKPANAAEPSGLAIA